MRRAVGRPRGSVDLTGTARRAAVGRRSGMNRVGRAIRHARESMNVAASELAAAIGVHPSSVHAWEAGAHCFSAWRLLAIADALGVPLASIVEDA